MLIEAFKTFDTSKTDKRKEEKKADIEKDFFSLRHKSRTKNEDEAIYESFEKENLKACCHNCFKPHLGKTF